MSLIISSPGISHLAGAAIQTSSIGRRKIRLTVFSGVKNLDKKVSKPKDSDNFRYLYNQITTQTGEMAISSPPSRKKKIEDDEDENEENKKKQDYYVNTGYAIRTLREEFPELFYRELTFDIYRDDIVFKDPLNTFVGIENYKSIFWALRFYGKIFFKALWVDIVSVWQPVESVIMVRWTVQGIPRIPWESRSRFDGTSEYKLDKDGKIYEHKIHNIALNGPKKFQVLSVDQLIQSLGCPSTPKPTYFEITSSSLKNILALMKFSTFKRCS